MPRQGSTSQGILNSSQVTTHCPFSGTYESVRALVSNGAVLLLLDAARELRDDSSILSWVFLALKQLAANNESVKQVRMRYLIPVLGSFLVYVGSSPRNLMFERFDVNELQVGKKSDDLNTRLSDFGM